MLKADTKAKQNKKLKAKPKKIIILSPINKNLSEKFIMIFKTTLYLQFPFCFNDSLQSSTQTSVKAPEMMTRGITVLLSSKRKDPSSSGSALITFFF